MPLSVAERSRRYREAHPERVAAATAAWAKRNPEKVCAKVKRWREAHPEYRRSAAAKAAKAKRYAAKHGDHLAAYHRNYRAVNQERLAKQRREHWQTHGDEGRARMTMANRERRAWLNALKDKPRLDCGQRFPPCVMDFDHVRGEKAFGIGRIFQGNKERTLAEISKCDLVCANCHRIRTAARRQNVARVA
jgi:hypothetical protein